MDDIKEILAEDMKLRKKLIHVIEVLIAVIAIGCVLLMYVFFKMQGYMDSMMEVLKSIDIDSLNSSIKNLNEAIEKFDIDALNQTLESTAKILTDVSEKLEKLSSFSLFN